MSTARVLTSFAVAAMTMATGACARGASSAASHAVAPTASRTIRFENEARVPVRVYLIGDEREWLLGRVDQAAAATLRVPAAALVATAGLARLAVLTDAAPTLRAARDPRAIFAVAQPVDEMLTQRWTFSQGQLAAPQLFGVRADAGRR